MCQLWFVRRWRQDLSKIPREYRDDGTGLFQRDEAHQHSVKTVCAVRRAAPFSWYPRLELHFLRLVERLTVIVRGRN
jgi:hypothetical protein